MSSLFSQGIENQELKEDIRSGHNRDIESRDTVDPDTTRTSVVSWTGSSFGRYHRTLQEIRE